MTFCLFKIGKKMKNIFIKLALLSSSAAILIASGSAPGGSGSNAAYELFNSTADKTSSFAGVAQQNNDNNGVIRLVKPAGSLQHKSGNIVIDDGDYSLKDSDGADDNNIVTDGKATLVYKGNFSDSYKYATTFQEAYTKNKIKYDVVGIIGIATKGTDMPKTKTATYKGEAEALVITKTSGFDLSKGKSTLTANFATSKISATLNGFTAVNQSTGKAGSAPIDEIKITDMSITNNQFKGGTVTTRKAGAAVNVVGGNASDDSQGNFYGLNAAGDAPAEVGGRVLIQGDDGIVSGLYLAK